LRDQDTQSAVVPGDLLSYDYEFNVPIPDVPNGTYTGTLNYVVFTNP
jgi:hypothetical protein